MGAIFKFVLLAIIVFAGVCMWTKFLDPTTNCNPFTFIINLVQMIICLSIKILLYLIYFSIQLIVSLFGVTLTVSPPNIPCP